jgi:vancomycin resistance protein YoaR
MPGRLAAVLRDLVRRGPGDRRGEVPPDRPDPDGRQGDRPVERKGPGAGQDGPTAARWRPANGQGGSLLDRLGPANGQGDRPAAPWATQDRQGWFEVGQGPEEPGGARKRRVPRAAVAGGLVVVLAAGLVTAVEVTGAGRVRHGVRVGGVDLSGLTRAGAGDRLEAAAEPIQAAPLVLQAGDATLRLPRSRAGVELDVEGSVDAAMDVGRGGPFDANRFKGWFGRIDLPWTARLATGRLNRQLAVLDRRVGSEVREPTLRIGGRTLAVAGAGGGAGAGGNAAATPGSTAADVHGRVHAPLHVQLDPDPGSGSGATAATAGALPVEQVPGRPGRAVDRAGAEAAVLAAAAAPAGTAVRLPIGERPPTVGKEAAAAAAERATTLLEAPVEVTAGDGRAELSPADLAPLVGLRAADGQLGLRLDPAGLDRLLRRRARFAYTEPRDARFQPAGSSIRILPGVAGLEVVPKKAATAVLEAGTAAAGSDRSAALPTTVTQPELTTKEAKALGVKEVMSTFTTTFNAGDAPRVHNIGLIAAAVHGSLVLPGQVFSMNAATGQRTAAKGYRTAHVIQNGEIVDGLGGGVCQAGTTMFNTAFFAGLPVTERRNHSLHISHYPMGRDATLDWPSTDLKFRNDSKYGIYITSRATPSTLTFTFWSTSRGYKVTSSTSAASNFRAPTTRYKDDPTLPKGEEVVEEAGSSGFDVTVWRTVTKGGTVVRRDTFVSNYRPWVRVVRRGTGPKEASDPGAGPPA